MKNKIELKDFILKCLDEKNIENISVIDLGIDSPLASYIIIGSGRSTKNISSVGDYVSFELKHQMNVSSSIEGIGGSEWVLVDAGDVIVHLFNPDVRGRYHFDRMKK